MPTRPTATNQAGVTATLACALVAGCAHYTPKPLDPVALAQPIAARNSAMVDVAMIAAVAAEVARLAPGTAVAPGRWDRLSLFAAALLHNRDIAAARSAVVSAQAGGRAARASAGPLLTLSSEYAGAATEASPWLFGAAIDVPLDIGGRRRTRLDAAALTIEVARYDLAEAIWTVRMAVRRTLAARLSADRQMALLADGVALRQRQFAAMARRVASGEATRADLERVRLDLVDAQRRVLAAQAQAVTATAALSAVTGVPLRLLQTASFDWQGFDVPVARAAIEPALRTAALVGRADVLKAVAAYDGSENDLRGEVAKQYPAISLAPGYIWERGLVKLPFNIGLALPPFDLNRRAILAGEARRAEAGVRLEAVLASASAALTAAEIERAAADKALAQVRAVDLGAARRLARQADNEIRVGAIDRTEWAAAQGGVLTVRLAELDALARVHAGVAALEDAARRPLEGPELAVLTSGNRP